ncbi:hypothetical protein [Salaquimonas pukyongi]|nr:hypothetical protein [Salaquimonas pukyongi]
MAGLYLASNLVAAGYGHLQIVYETAGGELVAGEFECGSFRA